MPTDGSVWDGVRERLDRVSIAPDLPGFGSQVELDNPSLEEMIGWLGPRIPAGAHVVGHDYGGILALAWAARNRVASLTLTSTVRGFGWLPAKVTAMSPLDRWFYRRWEGRLWLERGVSSERRAALLSQFYLRPGLGEWMATLARSMSLTAQHRLVPLPGARVLCLWGGADTNIRPWLGRRLSRDLGGLYEAIPGGRHYVMWEEPERYAEALVRFWEGRSPIHGADPGGNEQ